MSIDSTRSDLSIETATSARSPAGIVLTLKYRLLHLHLSPLRKVGNDLCRRLGAADPEFIFAHGSNGALSGVLGESSQEFGRSCASSTSRVPLKALLAFSRSFLSSTPRIANRTYIPSDNDVVRARLRTINVQE
jgi:hypothetical protein